METDSTSDAHLIRITNHGKIRTWVDHALDFLDENEDRPLVLHTLPAPAPATTSEPAPGQSKTSSSPALIPRLVTVAEIVKREHLKRLQARKSPVLVGVHQYNELGCIEDLPDASAPAAGRDVDVVAALAGKNVQIKRTVYMKITLCRKRMGELVERGATYQSPLTRQISKSAKQRARKRLKKQTEAGGSGSPAPVPAPAEG